AWARVQCKSDRGDQGTDGQRKPASDASDQSARPPAQYKHDHRKWKQRRSRLRRRVVLHLNEIERDEKEDDRERGVEEQRENIREQKWPRAKQMQRHHRVRGAMLDEKQTRKREGTDDERADHERMA